MRRLLLSAAGILTVGVMLGCNKLSGPESAFWDNASDVRGHDTLTIVEERELPVLVKLADAVVVVEITDVEDVVRTGPWPNPVQVEDASDKADLERDENVFADVPLATTYGAKVAEWVKGSGEATMSVVESGGLTSDGTPIFDDGSFLLEPGRKYLLLLYRNAQGDYQFSGWARWGFDLTDGVKVMNHPDTRDLEYLESESVDEFISYVRSLSEAN